jgi:hypothetical protein
MSGAVYGSPTMKLFIGIAFFAAFAVGCGSDDEKRPAECEAIVEACHPLDQGTGDIHACHEMAESDWTQAECVSNTTRCLNLCKTTDAGARG